MNKMPTLEIIETYNKCVDQLDDNKNCSTCIHRDNQAACDDCYNIMLGFPINPSNWEGEKT